MKEIMTSVVWTEGHLFERGNPDAETILDVMLHDSKDKGGFLDYPAAHLYPRHKDAVSVWDVLVDMDARWLKWLDSDRKRETPEKRRAKYLHMALNQLREDWARFFCESTPKETLQGLVDAAAALNGKIWTGEMEISIVPGVGVKVKDLFDYYEATHDDGDYLTNNFPEPF